MNLSDLYPLVLPAVPACPPQTAMLWIRQAAIVFCEGSLAWAVDLADTLSSVGSFSFTASLSAASSGTLTASWSGTTGQYFVVFDSGDQRTVTLTNGTTSATWSGAVTAGTEATWSKASYAMTFPAGAELVKLLEFTVDRAEAFVVSTKKGRELWRDNGGVDAAWTEDLTNFMVNPIPAESNLVYGLRAALRPTLAATSIPDAYGKPFQRQIAGGALGMLFAIPDQPWSNVLRAKEREDRFQDDILAAASRASKGFGRSRSRSRALFY